MIFSFGNQEAYGNPLEAQVGIHATSLLIEVGTLLTVTVCVLLFFSFWCIHNTDSHRRHGNSVPT